MNIKRECVTCNKDISHLDKRSMYCDKKCRNIDYANQRTERLRIESIEYYKDKPISSYIECKLCGHCAPDLSNHILKIHKITSDEYKLKFDVKVVKCQDECDKFKGSNNPAYQHGGKYSPFSDKFIKNDGTDDFKLKQESLKKVAYNNSLANGCYRPSNKEFWIAKGYTEAEAKILVSKSQSTFSLEKCIEKYGEIEGLERWKKRQEKWIKTLDAKSDEEKADINERKVPLLNFRSIWTNSLDMIGIFYIIKLTNGNIKIGITTKESIFKRYTQRTIFIDSILIEHKMQIKKAFAFEQTIKRTLEKYKIRKNEQLSIFGYTETFNTTGEHVLSLYNELMEGNNLYGKFIEYYPKAIRHDFEEVCRNN